MTENCSDCGKELDIWDRNLANFDVNNEEEVAELKTLLEKISPEEILYWAEYSYQDISETALSCAEEKLEEHVKTKEYNISDIQCCLDDVQVARVFGLIASEFRTYLENLYVGEHVYAFEDLISIVKGNFTDE